MYQLEPREPEKPKLLLAYSGEGPGSIAKTRIGTGDGGPELERWHLPDPPWWFLFLEPASRFQVRCFFKELPLERSMVFLKKCGVPPLYRVGLGLRWGFIVPERENFTFSDFTDILISAESPTRQLDEMERRAVYQLWRISRGLKLRDAEVWF